MQSFETVSIMMTEMMNGWYVPTYNNNDTTIYKAP